MRALPLAAIVTTGIDTTAIVKVTRHRSLRAAGRSLRHMIRVLPISSGIYAVVDTSHASPLARVWTCNDALAGVEPNFDKIAWKARIHIIRACAILREESNHGA